jgi:hypothetical protein
MTFAEIQKEEEQKEIRLFIEKNPFLVISIIDLINLHNKVNLMYYNILHLKDYINGMNL